MSILNWFRHKKNPLSRRERQVLYLIVEGKTNKEIALNLNIAEQTVKNHIDNLYQKIGVHKRVQAVVWAIRNGLG